MTIASRFLISILMGVVAASTAPAAPAAAPATPPPKVPNFIVILVDDAGFADLSCYGATRIRTPRLDALASEGLRLTSFYAQPVCGPSRGALMTGRYPNRIGGGWITNSEEVTLAEVLRGAGYKTACIGKWDMSNRAPTPGLIANDQGFDYYFGPLGATDAGWVRLFRNREPVGDHRDMGSLTMLYTDEALAWVAQHHHEPFFLYLAHSMPHTRVGASPRFRGKSAGGLYGDVIEELDWNIGRLVDRLRELEIDRRTVVLFASDNGPWLIRGDLSGSAHPLREGKGTAWEGGFRVPGIVWAPGRVPAGVVSNELASTLDLLPTFAAMAGAKLPADRVIDGRDQSDFLTGKTDRSARDTFFYHVRGNLHAVRSGRWKLALPNRKIFYDWAPDKRPVVTPELYDLETDVGEKQDVAAQHPDVVQALLKLAQQARDDVGDVQELPPGRRL